MQARVAAVEVKEFSQRYCLVGCIVVLRVCVTLAIFQPYCDLEAGSNQYLKW